jgi:hypothetical protein
MQRMSKRTWLIVLTLTLFAALPVAAQVTPAEKAAAEALFDRGIVALREGKLEEACARLEQSNSIERGIGTMLYLAECYEKSGRTASAWALFREAASEAQAGGQLERATAGRQRAERLESQLARLTIEVPPEHRVHGLEVRRNGTLVPQGAWGVALPVDPGEHVIEARATGFASQQQQVVVEKGPSLQRFEVPRLEAAPVAAISAPEVDATLDAGPPKGGTLAAPSAPPEPPRGLSKLKIAGIALGGAGVVLLAVGTGYGIRAIKKNDEAKQDCSANECRTSDGKEASDDAWRASKVANVGVIGGAALLAGGLLTYFLAPKTETQVAVSVGRHAVSLGLGGAF